MGGPETRTLLFHRTNAEAFREVASNLCAAFDFAAEKQREIWIRENGEKVQAEQFRRAARTRRGVMRPIFNSKIGRQASLTRVFVAVIAVAGISLAGCGGGSTQASSKKFEQTWSTSYGQTTCKQWFNDMTANERFVAAADMLVGAQKTERPDVDLPDDKLITRFEGDISEGCEPIATMKITDEATFIYLSAPDQYGP